MDQERKKLFMQALQKKFNQRNQKPTNSASNESNEFAHRRLNAPTSFGDKNSQCSLPGLNKEQDGIDSNSKENDAMDCENSPLMTDFMARRRTRSCIYTVLAINPKESECNLMIGNMPILREQPDEELEDETTNSIVVPEKLPNFGKDTVEYIVDEGAKNEYQTNENDSNLRSLDSGHNVESVSRLHKALNLHYADTDPDKDIDTSCSTFPHYTYVVIDDKKNKRWNLKDVTSLQEKKPKRKGMMFDSLPIANEDLGSSPIPQSIKNATNGKESSVVLDKLSPDDIVPLKNRERGIHRK